MAFKRCEDCEQVYDLNSDYDHVCPVPVVMDAEERWYALNDSWIGPH